MSSIRLRMATHPIDVGMLPIGKVYALEDWIKQLKLGNISSMPIAVLAFMAAFEQPPRASRLGSIKPEDFELAERLMSEEIGELTEGFNKFQEAQTFENMAEFVDGAIDSIYVILWSLLKFGIPVQDCFDEVQRSNMAKLQPDGTLLKNEFGKVQKPAGWTPPDLFGILQRQFDPAVYRGGIRIHTEGESS